MCDHPPSYIGSCSFSFRRRTTTRAQSPIASTGSRDHRQGTLQAEPAIREIPFSSDEAGQGRADTPPRVHATRLNGTQDAQPRHQASLDPCHRPRSALAGRYAARKGHRPRKEPHGLRPYPTASNESEALQSLTPVTSHSRFGTLHELGKRQ